MMMNGLILDDNMSNLTSASNEASISSSNRNEVGSLYPQQQSFASPNQPPLAKKKRNLPGNPDPEAEVMALSPKTLMATNRFICEICNKGFQRDQNLQLHRRGHNLPWKLKQRANKEVIKKKVYVCPEPTCVHHDPSRALGDLTGIKKHFSRKHGEKKWKCEKCSKRYAVQSDWKAHSKICGTREYRCDCGTLFSRRDSFITHRAFCDALAEESARSITLANHPLLSSSQPPITSSSHFNLHLQNHHLHNPPTLQPFPLMKREQQDQSFNNLIRPPTELPPWLACQPLVGEGGAPPPIDLSTQLFSSRLDQHQHQHHHSFIHHNENPNPSTSLSTTTTTPSLPSFQPTSSTHMSATALLQKAAQMGVTMSKPCPSESLILNRPHQAHHMSCSSTSLASSTAGSGLDLSSREEMEISGFSRSLASFGNKAVVTSGYMEQVGATMVGSSLPCGSGFEGSSSFEEALNGMLSPRMESHFQETFSKPAAMETHLRRSNEGGGVGGGNDGLTRDFLGLRTISHRGFPNMTGLDHMNSPSSSYDQQNQNQTPWQVRMQRGGWIPVLKHRGKPVAGRNMVSSEIYTVFVDNIPYSLDPKGLFNLFRKFGVVKDVFIPQKRRRITNTRFGFVRFSCEVAAQVAVQKAHGLWVDDKKLGVKFAEFERNKEHGQTHIQPPNRSKYRAEDRRGPNPFTNQKSFAEAVKGTKELRSGSVSIKAEEFGNGWLYSSVLVRLKARFINISLKIELEEKGIEGIAVRKCGGRDVLLSFQTKEEREIKMKAIKNIIEDWCELLIPWQPDLVLEPERLVWITCFGVPLQLWNRSNFIKIGSLWGEVLEGEEGVPQSFDCGKLRIITKCMEPINKVIHLESNQLSYPVRVLEDQIVVSKNFKQCCRCSTPQDVEEHHSSNEVRGSEVKFDFFRDAEPSQNHVDELTRHFGGESALGNAQTKMEARGKKPRGEVSVAEADKGELCRSDTAVAETCSMIGKELEAETCKAMVAVSSAFNGIRAAAQGQDGQVYTPGFMRSLSGSSLKRPGLNLEVVLGHHKLNSDLVDLYKGPNGPVFDESHINGMAMNVGPAIRESSVSQTKTQEANKISKSAALNSKGKEQAKGKRRTSYIRPQKGLLGLEKKAGLKGASTSKSVPQRSLFRASVAEASLLALTEKGGEGSQHLLDEAQACLQMGKLLGVDMLGKEKEVLNKIVELEVKDICRMDRGKDAVE